ncbi:MAG: hypothetical protein J7M18_03450 [Candidatus Eremiobacteraeota bacterium]|nr:hypothetical protein [Candidatus Eremiobacteraeota bacterium]
MNKKSILLTLILFVMACVISWGLVVSHPEAGTQGGASEIKMLQKLRQMKGKMGHGHCYMRKIVELGKLNLNNLKKFVRKVEATPEQEKKLKALVFKNQKERIKLTSKLKFKILDLASVFYEENIDAGRARSLIKEIGALKIEKQLLFLDQYFKVKEILTPEQLKKLETFGGFGRDMMRTAEPGRFTADLPIPPEPPENFGPAPPLPPEN